MLSQFLFFRERTAIFLLKVSTTRRPLSYSHVSSLIFCSSCSHVRRALFHWGVSQGDVMHNALLSELGVRLWLGHGCLRV